MSLGLFNEDTHRYGILLQQMSAIEVNHSNHSTINEYVGETLKLDIDIHVSEKRASSNHTPADSLSRLILMLIERHPSAMSTMCTDTTGRLWIPTDFQIEYHHPKRMVCRLSLQAPAPTKIDPSLLEAFQKPIDFKLGKIHLGEEKPREPRTNLLREAGDWKCT